MKKAVFAALVAVMMARPAMADECLPQKEMLKNLLTGQFMPENFRAAGDDTEIVTFVNPGGVWVEIYIPKKGQMCLRDGGADFHRVRERCS